MKPTICLQCGSIRAIDQNNVCFDCDKDNRRDRNKIDRLIKKGHSRHCACRQVFGDGECECDLYKQDYDPYAWMKKEEYPK